MKSADEHFLRTFMVLLISSFLCPTTSIGISPRCFPSLVDIWVDQGLNWCKFVVEQLNKSVSAYGRKNSVPGCLFYLVILYLDSLDTCDRQIPGGLPRISAWNKKLVAKVIEMDMKNIASFEKCFKKEVLCNAVGKFMHEVSGLEGSSGQAGKDSEHALLEGNNVEKNGGQRDEDMLPEDSSELPTEDMEDTSADEYGDESSVDGVSTDDPDWGEDQSNSSKQKRGTVFEKSKRGKTETEDAPTKFEQGAGKGSGHDTDTPEGDQDTGNRCTEEHANLVK